MVHIPDFRAKWEAYRTRAHLLSPHFPAGERVTHDSVARRIPHDPAAPVPATEGEGIAGAAFGYWLSGETLPDDRRRQWEELTRIAVPIWELDLAGFLRTIRTRAGEVLGWHGLVQTRAVAGAIQVRPEDRPLPGARLFQDGVDPFGEPPVVQLLWPDCIARVFVRGPAPKPEDEDRRMWMLADYGATAYMLDPTLSRSGSAPSSRINQTNWREGHGGGYVVLPRGVPGHVHQPPGTPLGTRFDVLVLVLNLSGQPDEIRTLFDALERRWLVSAPEVVAPPYQKMVRATLDEAASLIEAHDVRHALYRQKCEVVDRTTALGLAHG